MAEKGHDCKPLSFTKYSIAQCCIHSPFLLPLYTLVVFSPSKLHSPFFSSKLHATFFQRNIIHAAFFQCNNYTRRFFQKLHSPFFKSHVLNWGAIIRLVCFIKTKNHVNTVHLARNQICISRVEICIASAVNSKLLITRCCKSQNQRMVGRLQLASVASYKSKSVRRRRSIYRNVATWF